MGSETSPNVSVRSTLRKRFRTRLIATTKTADRLGLRTKALPQKDKTIAPLNLEPFS
jgi:hypothetical protein